MDLMYRWRGYGCSKATGKASYRLEDRVQVELPGEIKRLEHRCGQIQEDIRRYDMHRPSKEDGFRPLTNPCVQAQTQVK